jgi:hypothetical protein
MATYMAKQAGFIDSVLREPGEIFEYEGSQPGHWMMRVGEDAEFGKPTPTHVKTPEAKEGKAKAKPSRASDQSVI